MTFGSPPVDREPPPRPARPYARRRTRARWWIAFIITFVVAVGACRAWWLNEHHVAGLRAARHRWAALGWKNYSFTYTQGGGAGPALSIRVTVHGKRVDTALPSNPRGYANFYARVRRAAAHPMEHFFDALPDEAADASYSHTVTFDPHTGVPSSAEFKSAACCDAFWWFSITDVHRLP